MRLVLLAVLALSTLAACPSAPRSILTDAVQTTSAYRYVSVSKTSSDASTIESLLDREAHREAIVARYADDGRIAYVVRDNRETASLFAKVPFRSLDKARLVVRVERRSDVNGWGAGENGEVHRHKTLEIAFDKSELADAFALLQDLNISPLETVARVWPRSLEDIETQREVTLFELGYVVDVRAELVTGNPFDRETRVPLYGMAKRSAYRSL